LSFIPHDPINPSLCSLNCKDDPCEDSFSCEDCHRDARCRWNHYVYMNDSVPVPYGVCEYNGKKKRNQKCFANDFNPLPEVFGIPRERILPRALTACVSHCAEDNDLDASPFHKQILRANDNFVDSLVFVNTVGALSQSDSNAIISCVAQCVNVQLWPDHYSGQSNSVDVSPKIVKKRGDYSADSTTTTTVLVVSSTKGDEINKAPDTGSIVGAVLGGVAAAIVGLVVIGLLFMAYYKSKNSKPYCEQHDMYHHCH